MSDDFHYLTISAEQITFARAPNEQGRWRVLLLMQHEAEDTPWLAPNVRLSVSLSPAEARQMVAHLIEQADAAEAS
jgi:hypothetical protein